MERKKTYILETTDVFGTTTTMSTAVYEDHTGSNRESKDVDTRIKVFPYISKVLKKPRLVYIDKGCKGRTRYFDVITTDFSESPYVLVVVCKPLEDTQEIITWMPKKTVKQEDFTGGILYDSHKDD